MFDHDESGLQGNSGDRQDSKIDPVELNAREAPKSAAPPAAAAGQAEHKGRELHHHDRCALYEWRAIRPKEIQSSFPAGQSRTSALTILQQAAVRTAQKKFDFEEEKWWAGQCRHWEDRPARKTSTRKPKAPKAR